MLNPIPKNWLVEPRQKRIIVHWTVGGYTASPVCTASYHILVEHRDGKANLCRGDRPLNDSMPHTYMFNSAIGLSVCALGGYKSSKEPGKYPITKEQWELLVKAIAQLCKEYDIPVTNSTVLMHGEVTQNLGIDQWGKWDIGWLAHLDLHNAFSCGNQMRREVLELIQGPETLTKLAIRLQGSPEVLEGVLYDGSGVVPVRNFVAMASKANYDVSIPIVNPQYKNVGIEYNGKAFLVNYMLFPNDTRGFVSLRHLADQMNLEIDIEGWSPTRKVLVLRKKI